MTKESNYQRRGTKKINAKHKDEEQTKAQRKGKKKRSNKNEKQKNAQGE